MLCDYGACIYSDNFGYETHKELTRWEERESMIDFNVRPDGSEWPLANAPKARKNSNDGGSDSGTVADGMFYPFPHPVEDKEKVIDEDGKDNDDDSNELTEQAPVNRRGLIEDAPGFNSQEEVEEQSL